MGKDISEKKGYILISNFGKNGGGAGFLPKKSGINPCRRLVSRYAQVWWFSTMAPLR